MPTENSTKDTRVTGHVPVMGDDPGNFSQAAGQNEGYQDHHGELSGDIVNEARDKSHQQDGTHLLHLGAHHEIWNAGKKSDKARHQDPQQRVQPAQKHKGKVDDKVNGGENPHGNDILPLIPRPLTGSDIMFSPFWLDYANFVREK